MPSVTPSTGALGLSGHSLTVAPQSIKPSSGSLTATGLQPRVVGPRGIQPQTGSLNFTGNSPSQRRIRPGTGSIGFFANKPRVKQSTDPNGSGLVYYDWPTTNLGPMLEGETDVVAPADASMVTRVAGLNPPMRYFQVIVLDPLGANARRDPLIRSYYDPVGQDAHDERSGRSDIVGHPTPPSQKQGAPGFYRSYVPVQAGSWTVSIDVLIAHVENEIDESTHPDLFPLPRLTVVANSDVGLLADTVADAVDVINAWQTLTCSFTVVSTGVVEVRREKLSLGMGDVVFWDNLVATRV